MDSIAILISLCLYASVAFCDFLNEMFWAYFFVDLAVWDL